MSISEFTRQYGYFMETKQVFGIFEECFVAANGGKLEKEMVFCPVYGVSEDEAKMLERCSRLNVDNKTLDNDKEYFKVVPITLI